MEKEIIIKGEFTVEGVPGMAKMRQPLKYLKLSIGYIQMPLRVDEIISK